MKTILTLLTALLLAPLAALHAAEPVRLTKNAATGEVRFRHTVDVGPHRDGGGVSWHHATRGQVVRETDQ